MDQQSNSWVLFQKSAQDLASRLEEVQHPDANEMAREARHLVLIFQSWESVRPTNEVRIAAIHQLLNLNRRAMDFLSNYPRASRRPQPPSSRRPS
jgi:hypothetical protein